MISQKKKMRAAITVSGIPYYHGVAVSSVIYDAGFTKFRRGALIAVRCSTSSRDHCSDPRRARLWAPLERGEVKAKHLIALAPTGDPTAQVSAVAYSLICLKYI